MNEVLADLDDILEGDYPYLPEGSYQAKGETWIVGHFFVPRVLLVFKITKGEYSGTYITKFYSAKQSKVAGVHGKFVSKRRGDLIHDFYRLNPNHAKIKRMDRVPMTKLLNKKVLIDIDTVESNYKKKSHPSQMLYSRVSDIRLMP